MTPTTPSTIARGGKAIYGAPLGILMLEARFPRIPGDMGNATTWPFPVLYRVVRGASPEKVVLQGARGLLPDFIDAAKDLVRLGAEAITTNCGFLSLFQAELAAAVAVPVATSSLMQAPWVQATLPPGKRVGVVTISGSTLTPQHLAAVGAAPDTPTIGTENGREFFRVLIKAESDNMDVALAQQDVVDAGKSLCARHPDVGAVVLECTNMPPYAAALREAVGLPVYDIYSMINWFHAGLRPREILMMQMTHDKQDSAGDSIVERVYEQLKSMAIAYEFKPGERLNEGELSRRLSASRTPLREALNRLNSEGLLRFSPGKGYYCRDLDVNEVFSLYELRKAIEVAAMRLAIRRAKDADIDALLAFLDSTGPEPGGRSIVELVQLDESFHQRLLAMSGNVEMMRVLNNVNARIRFVRWIDMDRGDRKKTQIEHRSVLVRLKRRDEEGCVALLEKHIDRRLDQITAALKEGYARIYMASAPGAVVDAAQCSV